MIDGSTWRAALLVIVLLVPATATAAPPAPILNTPTSTNGQIIAEIAMERSGQYAAAVVNVDTPTVPIPGLGGTGTVQPTDPDVYLCDFAPVTSPASAQNCISARHASEPSGTDRLSQTIDATSFRLPGDSSLSARFAVGGPAKRVSFWSTTEQGARWTTTVPGDEPVVNVSITPNATRVFAATDSPLSGGGAVLHAYDAGGGPTLKWSYNVTDADGQRNGVRVRAMEQPKDSRWLVVGTTPPVNSQTGALLFLDADRAERPTQLPAKIGISGGITSLGLSEGGNFLVAGTTTAVYFFELKGGLPDPDKLPWSRSPSASGATAVAISDDGERFAAAFGESIHFYRRVHDTRIAEEIGQGYRTGATVSDISYDRTGRLLVATAGNRVFGFAPDVVDPIWSFDATQPAFGALDGPLTKVEVSQGADRLLVAGRTKLMPYQTRALATLAHDGPTNVTTLPGTSNRLTFTLQNTGSVEDEFSFRVTRPVGWTGATPEPVALLPNRTAQVALTVDVPAGHSPGTFELRVETLSSSLRNASRESRVHDVKLNLLVPRSVSLAIEPTEERFSLVKGGEKVIPVTFRNTGNAGGLINLSIEQELSRGSPWTVRFAEAQAQIGAGEESTINLIVDAPAEGASGDRNLLTIVAREGTYQATRTLTAYIDAEFGAELTASNDTLEFTQRAPRVVSVTVHNVGNTDDTFNLSYELTQSAANEWKVTLSMETITVPRGQTRSVGVTVEPLVAVPRTATLTVRAVSQSSLGGDEGSVGINLVHREPDPEEEDGSFLPGPPPALVALALVGAALAARRMRRGGA